MKYPGSAYHLLVKAVLKPTGWTLLMLLASYWLIQLLPETIKPPKDGSVRLFWLWQIAAIVQHFAAYWHFSKQAHPTFFSETKQTLDKGFLLGIAGLLVWTIAYPFALVSWKWESFIFRASIEIATWFLMSAYLCVNGWTLNALNRRIRANQAAGPVDEIDIRYCQLLRRTIVQVDLPCLIPFSIILVYALMNRSNMDWETYVLGASATLLFVSNILSSALTTLWEEERRDIS